MKNIWRYCSFVCSLVCLLTVLCGCRPVATTGPAQTPTPTRASTQASPTATASTASQSCPAPATARAATLPSISAGNHPNIVFLATLESSVTLQRYDVTTATASTILHETKLSEASVSPDGKWVVFDTLVQGQSAIQLIRIDGQQLQTLYCASGNDTIGTALLSPNQRFLIFNQISGDMRWDTVYLLDLTTGALRTEMSAQQPGYPGVTQGAFGQVALVSTLSAHPHTTLGQLNPLPSQHYPLYAPIKWRDNSSVYLQGMIPISGGTPPVFWYLLQDIARDAPQQQHNLQYIATQPNNDNCKNYAVLPDDQHIVCSIYPDGPGQNSTCAISTRPASGGRLHAIYTCANTFYMVARPVSSSTLLFIQETSASPATLWKMNADGSGLMQLLTAQKESELRFAGSNQLPWSVVSRDGQWYALEALNTRSGGQMVLFGALSGGAPKPLANPLLYSTLVGWTQF